jgi:hypothetical protein
MNALAAHARKTVPPGASSGLAATATFLGSAMFLATVIRPETATFLGKASAVSATFPATVILPVTATFPATPVVPNVQVSTLAPASLHASP